MGCASTGVAQSNIATVSLTVHAVNHAPVVTVPSVNVTASAGQVISASSLFSVTDADNDVLTYFLYDGTAGGGHFVVNGTAVADQTVVALSAAQLAQTTFQTGTMMDDLWARVNDGTEWSPWKEFHIV